MLLLGLFTLLASTIIARTCAERLDVSLVPQFGVTQGVGKDEIQKNSCTGFNGKLIPCDCPPDRTEFIFKLENAIKTGSFLGEPIIFSNDASDQSVETNKLRATACIIVLQNQNSRGEKGEGQLCPAASAPNFLAQQDSGIRNDLIFVKQ